MAKQKKLNSNGPHISRPQKGLTFQIQVWKGQVVLDFKQNVQWISLPANDARRLGEVLIKTANDLQGRPTIIPGEVQFHLKRKDDQS